MGEGVLRQWAHEVDIVLNKSAEQDATGWDFILEWPLEQEARSITPLDLAPSPLRCVIQVKSTDRNIRSWPVKLSNWLYLIRNPQPAFFLVLEFLKKSQCQNAYLIHVDERYIAKVQRRLREMSVSSKKRKLNKTTLEFAWDENDSLPSLDGPGLQAAIIKNLPGGIDAYVQRKAELCVSVGYESGRSEFKFKVNFPAHVDIDQLLVDFSLGIVPELDFESGEFFDRRFDIPVSLKKFEAGGTLQLMPSPGLHGRIVIAGGRGLAKLFLDCDVFVPKAFGKFVSPEKLVAKLVSGEWVFMVPLSANRAVSITYHPFQDSEECDLSVLWQSAQLILMMEDAFQSQMGLDLSMSIEGNKISSGKLEVSSPMPPPLLRWANIVHDAWILAQHFGVEQRVKSAVGRLARDEVRIKIAKSFVMTCSVRLKLSFWTDKNWRPRQARCCVAAPFELRLGSYVIQLAIALFGEPKPTQDIDNGSVQVDFLVDQALVCYEQIYDPGEENGKTHAELRGIVEEQYKDELDVIYMED